MSIHTALWWDSLVDRAEIRYHTAHMVVLWLDVSEQQYIWKYNRMTDPNDKILSHFAGLYVQKRGQSWIVHIYEMSSVLCDELIPGLLFLRYRVGCCYFCDVRSNVLSILHMVPQYLSLKDDSSSIQIIA